MSHVPTAYVSLHVPSDEPRVDSLAAFREKMAEHPPRTPAVTDTPFTPGTAAT